jgi:hypothetical protein
VRHDPSIDHHLSAVQARRHRDDADRRLPVVLRLQGLRREIEITARRLLRLLLLWLGALPVDADRDVRLGRISGEWFACGTFRPRFYCYIMSKDHEFRQNAELARQQAERTTSKEDRASWLRIAEGWMGMLARKKATPERNFEDAAERQGTRQQGSKQSHQTPPSVKRRIPTI